jgi:CTP:molybdopterin cytidylyltransferase MocA
MGDPSPWEPAVEIAGILLAAGAGSRFRAAGGQVKVLAPVRGRPLIEHPLQALRAAGLAEIVVVLGSAAAEIAAGSDLTGARVLVHPGWAEGMASSLQAALATLDDDIGSALVVLGDGPGLTREAVERVAARSALGDAPLVGARYANGRAHPVAIHRALWSRLPQRGEDGARALGSAPVDVDCSDLAAPGDADTPDQLQG